MSQKTTPPQGDDTAVPDLGRAVRRAAGGGGYMWIFHTGVPDQKRYAGGT